MRGDTGLWVKEERAAQALLGLSLKDKSGKETETIIHLLSIHQISIISLMITCWDWRSGACQSSGLQSRFVLGPG